LSQKARTIGAAHSEDLHGFD